MNNVQDYTQLRDGQTPEQKIVDLRNGMLLLDEKIADGTIPPEDKVKAWEMQNELHEAIQILRGDNGKG